MKVAERGSFEKVYRIVSSHDVICNNNEFVFEKVVKFVSNIVIIYANGFYKFYKHGKTQPENMMTYLE